ncbi:Rad52/Rad22 family DNA repair protein [Brevibacillus agri]|uniref:Rad52/Rad22 family DNA repair protein n=1 Tax=Brevibacillus agri TaxID=51101 RepID=UPI0025B67779|nr:Rad52/Rad22 family DNA repair protein [Brevibacillus agri]MDN4094335.1 Rad52/Rad22 family DNA repair protein [Brevibacillus agri]
MNLELLTKQFPREAIKSRQGKKGMTYYYVPAGLVIERLNEALNYKWSFTVVKEYIFETEAVVLGELKIGADIVKQAFGNAPINNGAIGDALKSATSDSIRKNAAALNVPCIFHTQANSEQQQGNNQQSSPQSPQQQQTDNPYRCSVCDANITKQIHDYSFRTFNKVLCMKHQQEARKQAR